MITRVGAISLPNNAALAQGLRVKLAAGYLAAAGADDECIGTMEHRSLSTETKGTVDPFFAPRHGVAGEAFALHAVLYRGASGTIVDTADGEPIGIALEAASGANSCVEWLPFTTRLDA